MVRGRRSNPKKQGVGKAHRNSTKKGRIQSFVVRKGGQGDRQSKKFRAIAVVGEAVKEEEGVLLIANPTRRCSLNLHRSVSAR